MARKKKTDKSKPIESLKHKDKRSNIPTEELRDFVKEDENSPEADADRSWYRVFLCSTGAKSSCVP